MTDEPRLIGPRVCLRALERSDVKALYELSCDDAVTRHMEWDTPKTPAETEAFVERAITEHCDKTKQIYHFCITLVEDGSPIGVTSLTNLHPVHRRATIGSWIGRPHWGKGLMRETKALFLEFAFGELQLERVQAWVDIDNQRSLYSLEKCGFRREGVARRMVRHGDQFTNQVLLAILRGEERDLVARTLKRSA